MITLTEKNNIYLHIEAIDMRKQINGLLALIIDEFRAQPQTGHVYVFYIRSRDKVKVIYWDRNGFILIYKRLEKHKFKIPKNLSDEALTITHDQLQWLLAGLDFTLMKQFSELDYSNYY